MQFLNLYKQRFARDLLAMFIGTFHDQDHTESYKVGITVTNHSLTKLIKASITKDEYSCTLSWIPKISFND